MFKTKTAWIILLSGSFLMLAACSSNSGAHQETETTVQAPEEKVYSRHCANCHGGNLQGGFGPALTGVGKKYSRDEILSIIQKGKGDMPSQDYVKKEDQQKLADWLSGLK
ncbi:MAG: cytochrome c [Thermoactinomyces sp.]